MSPRSPPLFLPKLGDLEASGQEVEVGKHRIHTNGLSCFCPIPPPPSGDGCANSGSEAHRTPRALCPSTHLHPRADNKPRLRETGFPAQPCKARAPAACPRVPSCSILPAPGFSANTPASIPGIKAGLAKDIPGFLSWFLGFSQAKPATFGLFLPTGRVVWGGPQSGNPLLPQRASAPHLAPTQPLVVMVEKAHPGLPLLLPGSLLLGHRLRGGHHGCGDLHRPPL